MGKWGRGILGSGLLLTVLFCFLQATPVLGKDKEKDVVENNRPIVITADGLEVDNKSKTAIFSGNVVAKQDQKGKEPIFIYCDAMTVYYVEDSGKKSPAPAKSSGEKKDLTEQNRVDRIIASGRVKILQGKDVATGEQAIFYNSDQRIVLSGDPKVWQGKNLIKGEEITVWIKENRSRVTSKGSNRVQAVIHQEEKQ
jgi:lipopolysaccharide export system protein LptA